MNFLHVLSLKRVLLKWLQIPLNHFYNIILGSVIAVEMFSQIPCVVAKKKPEIIFLILKLKLIIWKFRK